MINMNDETSHCRRGRGKPQVGNPTNWDTMVSGVWDPAWAKEFNAEHSAKFQIKCAMVLHRNDLPHIYMAGFAFVSN